MTALRRHAGVWAARRVRSARRTLAALRRVIALARDMRTWPVDLAANCAERIAEAVTGRPAPYGHAVDQLGVVEEALDHADGDEWRTRAVLAERQLSIARNTLNEVLGMFTEHGHPGRPCVRTGWIDAWRVQQWCAELLHPKRGEGPARTERPADTGDERLVDGPNGGA
ncbi:hypothetical protein GCM10017673_40090 [Streptosporangium violaceochromogenes]|nr:hypothetical protein GCM10017673_40090 [Streptosporangium violaceochromogenes]